MNAIRGKMISVVVALAMVAGGAQACREEYGPSAGMETTRIAPTTAATVDPTETAGTTPEATTPEPTATPTTAPTDPTEATAEPTTAPTVVPETTETIPAPTETENGETPVDKTVYATGTINIRSGPGTSYSKVRTVSAGTALSVVARTANSWYRLEDSTYVSISVVTDTMPTPTPTPDPYATPTPAGISASEATAITKSIITTIRSGNGLTTNFAPELNTRCYKSALRFIISHSIPNGTLESCGGILKSGDQWTSWFDVFDSSEEAVRFLAEYLIVEHVASMATDPDMTEFGAGVAKNVYTDPWGEIQVEYYIYISCATPDQLQGQIDAGWYD